jgi:hypothetical protein
MWPFRILIPMLALAAGWAAGAQTLSHHAENQVPVTLVQVTRAAQFTELSLRADTDLKGVCWTHGAADSPYLLADGKRYRFLRGRNITACPNRRAYKGGETMLLSFEPLPASAHQMSMVEGEGGEKQMADPASQPGIRYWNFLHVALP